MRLLQVAILFLATLGATAAQAEFLLRVPLPGTPADAPPGLALSPSSADFGTVVLPDTGALSVTLSNTASTPLEVGAIAGTAPPFGLAHDCPVTLDPGASCTLSLTFAPTSEGRVSRTISVGGKSLYLTGLGNVVGISHLDSGSTLAVVKDDGSLWQVGSSLYGQLGRGDTVSSVDFMRVTSLGNSVAKATSTAVSTLVLKKDGTVWGAGQNWYGQLGLGDTINRSTFTQSTALGNDVVDVAAGNLHVLALKSDGTVWGMGSNGWFQFGMSTASTSVTTPVQLTVLPPVSKIAVGNLTSAVIDRDGWLWTAGWNYFGQRGFTGANIYFTKATDLGNNVVEVCLGGYHTVVRKGDGTVWATGLNSEGQLGLGDTVDRSSFTQISALPVSASKLACGSESTLVLGSDGSVWAFGDNSYGTLGLGDTVDRYLPTQVPLPGGLTAVEISTGEDSSVIRLSDGTIWGTGQANYGQLGLGDTVNRSSLTRITQTGN